MKYLYGPVASRRLGLSLGITLTPYKICSFDCVYCQLGATCELTIERKEYVPLNAILDELRIWLKAHPLDAERLNFISLAGLGEPTLYSRMGELIAGIKRLTDVRVCVITNASLLSELVVRSSVKEADVILPSLDAANIDVFERIDRPKAAINLEQVIEGLVSLRKEFSGQMWLEVMLVEGVNDDWEHIKLLKSAIDKIRPDKIQLNSPVRATTERDVRALDRKKLEKIQELFGTRCEIL
jgi:wyosine [tRNA(Phe)-imidazoG37] synthetase (radical SAM superfamily)